jgi:hypothetical protein
MAVESLTAAGADAKIIARCPSVAFGVLRSLTAWPKLAA